MASRKNKRTSTPKKLKAKAGAARAAGKVTQRRRVATVFGAGVAGLTAAHELIERGFQVEVWECADDERVPARGCAVGGMARTQWAAIPWSEQFDERANLIDWKQSAADPIKHLETELYVKAKEVVSSHSLEVGATPKWVQQQLGVGETGHDAPIAETTAAIYIECLCCGPKPSEGSETTAETATRRKRQEKLARATIDRVLQGCVTGKATDNSLVLIHGKAKIPLLIRVLECPVSEPVPDGTEVLIRFRKRERWVPGEHGYRFFPSFYCHLFDTMGRTPILAPTEKTELNRLQEQAEFDRIEHSARPDPFRYEESGRTVFDNLIPAKAHALAFEDNYAPLTFPRYRVGSLMAVLRQWRTAMERLNYSPRDLARYALRIQEYALMSGIRRQQLEGVSWWCFVGGEERGYYSRDFKTKIARWTEGLVAMSAEDCDARTYGSVLLQLIFDQYRGERDYRDGILNGPTSDAWLDPWRRYLEAQGVRFIHGELKGFKENGGDLWPEVACFEPRYPGALDGKPQLLDGYFVVALPLQEAQRVVSGLDLDKSTLKDRRDLKALKDMNAGGLEEPRPDGCLRHFAGVQYYFREDLSWVHGHLYYPDSPWGLSSISQARFWQDRHDWEHGYRGLMSVIVGVWDARSPKTQKTAWESSPEEIAEEVFRQIRVALEGPNDERLGEIDSDEMRKLPDPIYWRLDSNFTPNESSPGYKNEMPLLVNLPGEWEKRPGSLPASATTNSDSSKKKEKDYGYAVCGGVVLAGTYMQTYTRLTTMEAANESARHAVNAILMEFMPSSAAEARSSQVAADERISKLCKIFPLEHREPADLGPIRDLDARLARVESRLGEVKGRSLIGALGLDRWTAFLPKQRP